MRNGYWGRLTIKWMLLTIRRNWTRFYLVCKFTRTKIHCKLIKVGHFYHCRSVYGSERRTDWPIDVSDDRPADSGRRDIQVILIESAATNRNQLRSDSNAVSDTQWDRYKKYSRHSDRGSIDRARVYEKIADECDFRPWMRDAERKRSHRPI